jgi:multicomponent Na+:H+ antiporter subunit G
MRPYFYDAAVILSVAVMTLGVFGIWRMPDVYTKLHAASKAVFLGIVVLALTSTVLVEGEIVYRVLLVGLVVVITTPISSHVIGRAAYLMHERMETPGAVDESGSQPKEEKPTWRL